MSSISGPTTPNLDILPFDITHQITRHLSPADTIYLALASPRLYSQYRDMKPAWCDPGEQISRDNYRLRLKIEKAIGEKYVGIRGMAFLG